MTVRYPLDRYPVDVDHRWIDQLAVEGAAILGVTWDGGLPGGWMPRMHSPVEPCERCGTPIFLARGEGLPSGYDQPPRWCQFVGTRPMSRRLGLVYIAPDGSEVDAVIDEHTRDRCHRPP